MNRLTHPVAAQIGAVHADWRELVNDWACSRAGQATILAVDRRVSQGAVVYPDRIFRALELTALHQTRVVILGQDPYHGEGQAEGLAFSVPAGQRMPPSLRNIHRELQRDLALSPPVSGSLLSWARSGVLLLNTSLTVEAGQPASHARLGWQVLTDRIVKALAGDLEPKVFMLWGAHAQAKSVLLDAGGVHCILASNHPSPLSASRPPAPFIGNGHFSAANSFLVKAGRGAVDWGLT